jgi:hypothetical protein
MDAMLTLYLLGGCVGLAVVVFVIMSITSALRAPKLPDAAAFEHVPLPVRFVRALTPRPVATRASQPAIGDRDSWSEMLDRARVPEAPRTVIPLPAIAGIAPATAAKRSDWLSAADTALAAAARGERAIIEDDWGNDITREGERLPQAAALIALPSPSARKAPAPSPLVMAPVASYGAASAMMLAQVPADESGVRAEALVIAEEPAEDWAALRAVADAQASTAAPATRRSAPAVVAPSRSSAPLAAAAAPLVARPSAPALAWSPPPPASPALVENSDLADNDSDWDESSAPGVAAYAHVAPPAAPRTRWPRATENQAAPAPAAQARKSATSWQLPADVALAPARTSAPQLAWSQGPIIRTDGDVEKPLARTRPGLDRQSTFRVPRAPAKRHGLAWTLMGWLFATAMTAASVAIVEPTLLDPLIEDYEWDGAPYAATARDYAWDAHAALDMSDVTVTALERLPSPPAPESY